MIFPTLIVLITLFVATAFLYIWKRRDEGDSSETTR